MTLSRDEALALLDDARSAQRRRGAKRLRALADPTTAPQVRRALDREVQDVRTWETQYQLVMALGATGDGRDVGRLRELALQPRYATMVNCALGDALVRLGREHRDDPEPVLWCHRQGVDLLDEGAQRATAVLRLVLPDAAVREVVDRAEQRLGDPDHPLDTLGLWVVIAAAGWRGDRVAAFLDRCARDHREDVARAAREAQQGRYLRVGHL